MFILKLHEKPFYNLPFATVGFNWNTLALRVSRIAELSSYFSQLFQTSNLLALELFWTKLLFPDCINKTKYNGNRVLIMNLSSTEFSLCSSGNLPKKDSYSKLITTLPLGRVCKQFENIIFSISFL